MYSVHLFAFYIALVYSVHLFAFYIALVYSVHLSTLLLFALSCLLKCTVFKTLFILLHEKLSTLLK